MSKQKTKPTNYIYQLVWLRNIIVFLSTVPIWAFTLWYSYQVLGENGLFVTTMIFWVSFLYFVWDAAVYAVMEKHIHTNILNSLRPTKESEGA